MKLATAAGRELKAQRRHLDRLRQRVSALAGYGDPAALTVAGQLDDEVLTLLRGAA